MRIKRKPSATQSEVEVVGPEVARTVACCAEYCVECLLFAEDEAPAVAEGFDRVDCGLKFGFDDLK